MIGRNCLTTSDLVRYVVNGKYSETNMTEKQFPFPSPRKENRDKKAGDKISNARLDVFQFLVTKTSAGTSNATS